MNSAQVQARQALGKRIYKSAKLTGEFTLRSGTVSNTYFDKYQFEADPLLLRDITLAMQPLVDPTTQVLAGLEMGGLPLVTLLSQHTGLPCAFIRKEAKTYGTCLMAEGASIAHQPICLVEDVVSTGGALVEKVKQLRSTSSIIQALCVIDRQSGGREALAELGVPLIALFNMEDLEQFSDA